MWKQMKKTREYLFSASQKQRMPIHFLASEASGCAVFALEYKHTNNECFSHSPMPHPPPFSQLLLNDEYNITV